MNNLFKKFNWGHGITLFYIIFVGAIFTALFASMQVDHGLVVEDYYQLDLQYQERYNEIENSFEIKDPDVFVNKEEQLLTVNFGETSAVSGSILYYRPSNKNMDITQKVSTSHVEKKTDKMLPGRWIMKMSWKANNKNYYAEKEIYI